MLLVFLLAAGALIYGVHAILTMEPATEGAAKTSTSLKPSPSPEEARQSGPATANSGIRALPTPEPEQPTLIEPPPELPDGIEARPPGMEALAVLESFLTAKTLEERMPLIETKTPAEELATSCLAGPLPATSNVYMEYQESNPLEEVVDFYYTVDFVNPDQRDMRQMILVRTRGTTDPKVVVDPFLDLYGGRLAAYAATPSENSGIFQVIIYAVATCLEPDIPEPEKKRTLKLLASENSSREIAMATFGKQSKIGEMLEDGTYNISYGKAKPCTVMLRWNTEDAPKHPYLEALTIKALDWNP